MNLGILDILFYLLPPIRNWLARPRIQIEKVYVDWRDVISITEGATQRQSRARFAHVQFRNKPLPSWLAMTRSATHLRARITSYEEAGVSCRFNPIYGRWGDTDQPSSQPPFSSTLKLTEIGLPPNNQPRELDIAMKYIGEEDCYAFNNESYSYPEFRHPGFLLGPACYRVKVNLVADNLSTTKQFTLSNTGAEETDFELHL